jgi:hypothetical protein
MKSGLIAFWLLVIVADVALYVTIAYIAYHFITKFW